MFNPLGISDKFSFPNNFNDQKMHFIQTKKIFPRSREAFPCRVTFIGSGNSQLTYNEQRYPFGKKFLSLIVKFDLDSYQEPFRSMRLLVCKWLVLGYDSGDSTTSALTA